MFRSTAGERSNRKDDVIIGMAAFQKSLHNIDTTMIRKTLGKATREGAKPILKAMRSEVKPISKTMAKALGVNIKVYKRNRVVVGIIGIKNNPSVRAPYSDPRNRNRGKDGSRGIHDPRFTFHLVDLGTKPHMARFFGKAFFMHPGTQAENVRSDALKTASSAASVAYEVALQKAVNEVIG